ncbi:MAG: endo alpha-1,4 polygalactosaminidase [Actinomycetia bacterium]|nr:endo alpha-1,4 polygalactosaminidase [Actinomycetes bacterium]
MGRVLGLATATLVAVVGCTGVVYAPASQAAEDPVLPTANAKWDYQIGKPYDPRDGVTLVSRDRTEAPLADGYTMCYINAYQTQPDAAKWWKNNHDDLLLKKDGGGYVVDSYWGEILFDISTADKRDELAGIINGWITGCADDGFGAIEPDNLDSWTRSGGRLTRDQAFAYAKLIIDRAHAAGLAIGQKNAAGQTQQGTAAGFDFAVAEECGRYRECSAYTADYADQVYVIEYRSQDFKYSCQRWGDELSIILRDRKVTAPGSKSYVYRSC